MALSKIYFWVKTILRFPFEFSVLFKIIGMGYNTQFGSELNLSAT